MNIHVAARSVECSLRPYLSERQAPPSPLATSLSLTERPMFAAVALGILPEQSEPDTAMLGRLQRQVVSYQTQAAAGTIVIAGQTFLYFVLGDGTAIRYGIGVGRDGFSWAGTEVVTRKAEWPDWTPPQEMIARQPYLPRWMAGGEGNPLGARAIYFGTQSIVFTAPTCRKRLVTKYRAAASACSTLT